ncbi:hypothetical protein C0J52_15018, partial [Blattella germanica]
NVNLEITVCALICPDKLFISADGPNYKQFGKESAPARPVPSVHFDQWRGREQNGTSLEPLLPGMSNSSLVITFIGEFVTELPRKPQQVACEYLLEEGIKRGKVKEEYDLNDSPRFPKAGSPGIMVMQRFLRSQPDYQSDEDYNQTSP